MSAKHFFNDLARGTALGTGMLPGVSAGTVGIIVNVYDKLINGIDGLRKKATFWKSLLSILPIGIGCLLSTFLLLLFWSKVANPYFPFPLIAALAGFVIGAMPILTAEVKDHPLTGGDFARMGIGFLIAAGIGVCAFLSAAGVIPLNLDFQAPIDAPFNSPWIFLVVLLVGFLSAFSCLIPGISGAMILFIFSLYNPIVGLFFTQMDGGVVHKSIFADTSLLPGGLTIIAVFLVGMLVGFLLVSGLMKSLLAKHRHGTFTVIIGCVLGSIVSMFLNNDMWGVYTNPQTNAWWQFVLGGVLLIAVAIGTYFLIRRAHKLAKEHPPLVDEQPEKPKQ